MLRERTHIAAKFHIFVLYKIELLSTKIEYYYYLISFVLFRSYDINKKRKSLSFQAIMLNGTNSIQCRYILVVAPDQNKTFESETQLLESVGIYFTLGLLSLTLTSFIAIIGLVFNLITCLVLFKQQTLNKLFFYFKIITVLSTLISVFQIVIALFMSRPLLNVSDHPLAQYYVSYFHLPVVGVIGWFKITMNTVILLDRIVIFRPHLSGKILSNSPIKNIAVAFVVSAVVMITQFVSYIPYEYTVYTSDQSGEVKLYKHFYVTEVNPRAEKLRVKIFLNIVSFLRSIVWLVLDVILNIISIRLYQRFLLQKRKLTIPLLVLPSNNNNNNNVINNISNMGDRTEEPQPLSGNENVCSHGGGSIKRRRSRISTAIASSLMDFECNMTKFTIINCSFSIFHQTLILSTYFYVIFVGMEESTQMIYATNFVNTVKNSSTFFIFYLFNKKLRTDFNKFFNLV